jgi:hypothetical protein
LYDFIPVFVMNSLYSRLGFADKDFGLREKLPESGWGN